MKPKYLTYLKYNGIDIFKMKARYQNLKENWDRKEGILGVEDNKPVVTDLLKVIRTQNIEPDFSLIEISMKCELWSPFRGKEMYNRIVGTRENQQTITYLFKGEVLNLLIYWYQVWKECLIQKTMQ